MFLSRFKLLAVTMLVATVAAADCVEDLRGDVFCGGGRCIVDKEGTVHCSRFKDGDADITLDGHVLCGKGNCVKDADGTIFCSSEIGGAALLDSRGRARCQGSCEAASRAYCETTRAGIGD